MQQSQQGTATKDFTRFSVGIIGAIFVVLAIFCLWIGIQANYSPELNLLNMNKQASYACTFVGIALFGTATMGWVAATTKNECLSFGFGYLTMVCFLVCTALGSGVLVEKSLLMDQLKEGCKLQSGMIYELDTMFQQGKDMLCSDKCPCNVDKGIFSTEISEKMVTDSLGATRLDQCPQINTIVTTAQRTKYYPILEILETDWQCAGFCTEGNYYLFSDVRTGVPKNGECMDEIVKSVKNHATPYAVILLVIGALGLAGTILSFIICRLTGRKFNGKPMYNYNKFGMSKND